MEEPPWSCGPRTVSNASGDRPYHYCGLLPVSDGNGILRGGLKPNRLRGHKVTTQHLTALSFIVLEPF